MIINNVMLKLKNSDSETVSNVKNELLTMKGKVDVLKDIQVHTDILKQDPNFDIFFQTKFASMKDFDAYKIHPKHIKVTEKIGGNIASSASVCARSNE
ncbi:MAG: Dabb family protein [Methanobacterium sp.]|nr:Dabb family protein [Methanobacterium sp.]